MRQITKDIEITIDGAPVGFRLTKLDAFFGVALLRLLMRLNGNPTMLGLIRMHDHQSNDLIIFFSAINGIALNDISEIIGDN